MLGRVFPCTPSPGSVGSAASVDATSVNHCKRSAKFSIKSAVLAGRVGVPARTLRDNKMTRDGHFVTGSERQFDKQERRNSKLKRLAISSPGCGA